MTNSTVAAVVLVGSVVLTYGCGTSPTGPTRTDPSVQSSNATTNPNPAPPAPTPTPAPPAPAPAPQPEPPRPAAWEASTTSAHWRGEPLVPETFDVSWTAEVVRFGPIVAPPVVFHARSIIVKITGPEPELSILYDESTGRGSWTYTGAKGLAAGVLVRR